LALLADAEQAAGSDAALFAASAELVRSEALTRLGDVEGARRHRETGITAARTMELTYELALLLVLDAEPAAQREGLEILVSLGVEPPADQFEVLGSSSP